MKLITSIFPRNVAHQVECMSSWRESGFDIISVNHPSESQTLHDMPKWIKFVEREFSLYHGRPFVPLNTIFDVVADLDANALITNSDIKLDPKFKFDAEFCHELLTEFRSFFSARVDVENHHAVTGTPMVNGVDVFGITPAIAKSVPRSGLRFGKPWWDTALSFWLASQSPPAGRISDPSPFLHVLHSTQWSKKDIGYFWGDVEIFLQDAGIDAGIFKLIDNFMSNYNDPKIYHWVRGYEREKGSFGLYKTKLSKEHRKNRTLFRTVRQILNAGPFRSWKISEQKVKIHTVDIVFPSLLYYTIIQSRPIHLAKRNLELSEIEGEVVRQLKDVL